MRILVTGGSGFLGSHVADALTDAGHDVELFDQAPSPWIRDNQTIVRGDIRDAGAVDLAVEGCDAVYHLAAIADLEVAKQDPPRTIEVNVLGTAHVLEAARRHAVDRIVIASSVYVHSDTGSIYRTSKRAAEALVRDYSEQWELPTTILRFGSLYGPRADPGNAVRRIIDQAVRTRRVDFWGNGTEVREYIHVADAAALAVDALDDRFIGDVLHLTGQERVTTRELLDLIDEMLGGELDVTFANTSFAGRYRLTPYSLGAHRTDLGRRLTGRTHIDLGLGLLQCLADADAQVAEGSAPHTQQ